MARVVLLTLRFWPATGGVEARVTEVTRRLAGKHDITVLTSDLRREKPFARFAPGEAEATLEGARIVRLPAAKVMPVEGYGVHLRGLRAALREHLPNADLLDAQSYGAAHTDLAVPLAKAAGKPVALTTHFHPAETAAHPFLRQAYDTLRGGPVLRRADRVVTMTRLEATALRERFQVAEERLRVVPSGLDTRRFREGTGAREEGLLLAVGRLSPVKGFDHALEALALLRQQGLEVRLVVAGEDWGEGARLRALAERLGVAERVQFTGRVGEDALLALYQRAQVLLAPSRYEALGLVAMEAVACGCPAVVAQGTGLEDAAGPGGLAVPRDAKAFADAARRILQDAGLRQRLSKAGKGHAAEHDWDRVAASVDALYRELA